MRPLRSSWRGCLLGLGASVLVGVSAITFSGCAIHGGHGPPPRASAHGHRHVLRSGVELRFDSELGVWVAVGRRHLYWQDGLFLRIARDLWEVSATLEGPWRLRGASSLPPGLRSRYADGDPQ